MSMTPENATRSWRELSDQLTPEQIAELEAHAHAHSGTRVHELRAAYPGLQYVDTGPRWDDAALLTEARARACDNLTAAMIGDVPVPPGARADVWQDDGDAPQPYRVRFGAYRTVAGPHGADLDGRDSVRGRQHRRWRYRAAERRHS